MKKQNISSLNREELKSYLFDIQDSIDAHLKKGKSIDSFIDDSDILDEFEKWLPDEEYGIFVITMLNGIKSETVINTLLDSLLRRIQSKEAVLHS